MSQNQSILDVLTDRKGQWVSMIELIVASGSYNIHSRISELRKKRGVPVENRTEQKPTPKDPRRKISFYRIPAA